LFLRWEQLYAGDLVLLVEFMWVLMESIYKKEFKRKQAESKHEKDKAEEGAT